MPEVPPPGPQLSFVDWCRVLADLVRELVPTVRATRAGVVYLRHADEVVTIREDYACKRNRRGPGYFPGLAVW